MDIDFPNHLSIFVQYFFHRIIGPQLHHNDDWSRLSTSFQWPILPQLAGHEYSGKCSVETHLLDGISKYFHFNVSLVETAQQKLASCYFADVVVVFVVYKQGEWLRQGLTFDIGEYIVGKS